jgi:hypothetical protein
MTTVLANAKAGVMVADSHMTDEDRAWSVRKVYRIRGALVACAGSILCGEAFRDWWAAGAQEAPEFDMTDSQALVLDASGLYIFDSNVLGITRVPGGIEAIGTGAKGALCAYKALGFSDPIRAVRIACKYDNGSRPPVRSYKL